jgi:thiol:disulfide interchange protein DsbD
MLALARPLRLLAFLLLCALPAGSALRAQVEASLVALAPGEADSGPGELVVGLRLVHQPHWHTYWLQPGTGYPTSIEWQLPPGWTAGPIRWPAPHRVYDSAKNLAGNGYENVVTLPVTLVPPAGYDPAAPVTLRAKAEWLMCKDVCVPGSAELTLALPAPASGPARTDLRRALRNLPKPAPSDWEISATPRAGGKTIRLSILSRRAYPVLAGEPWFFAADAAIAYDQPQTRVLAGLLAENLVLDLAVADYADPKPTRLTGVLTFADGSAYTLDAPFTTTGSTTADLRPATFDPRPSSASGTTSASPSAPAAPAAPLTALSLAAILATAYFGGLILNLMPCVFPVLGLKVLGFVQQAGSDRKKITAHGLVFTSGVLLSFWTLAAGLAVLRAGGQQLGWGFQLQEPAFVFALAAVLLAFALNMSGVFECALGATAIGGNLQQKQGLGGSFFTGVLATVVATPCSAPFLAPALGAALALPVATGFVVFTAIGLGLSTPYLVLAAYPAAVRALPRPGAWMEAFKQGMAFLLYGTVGLMIWILAGQLSAERLLSVLLALTGLAFALWLYGRATMPGARRSTGNRIAFGLAWVLAAGAIAAGWPRADAPDEIVWEPWSTERVAALQQEGRPIYVDFTARWCFTCQTNKKAVFHGPGSGEVLKAFHDRKVATLRGDWTNRDPLITAELARWNRAAVPFNLVYLPGQAEPRTLPELLTPGVVLDALKP